MFVTALFALLNGWLSVADWGYWLRFFVEIAILSVVIYHALRAFERFSAGGKIKGIAVILAAVVLSWMLARWLQLHAISWLLQAGLGVVALVMVVVFQPELRRLITRLGGAVTIGDSAVPGIDSVPALVDAIEYMSDKRIGALIVIERRDHLEDFISTSALDCQLTAKSLIALFWKDSPYHDGAVVVRRGRISGAGVILPLTDNPDYRHLSGTRHRAAIGISEDTDALALVVSEESGTISVADRGRITRHLGRQDLEILLNRMFRASLAAGSEGVAS